MPFLLIGCGPDTPERKARPAMWLVADDDTKIYMLGTVHALPPGTDWDDGAIGDAISAADELIMELSPDELAAAGAIFRKLAPRDVALPIADRLSPSQYANYRTLEASGGGFGGDALDDWAVLVLMGQRVADEAGLRSDHGVESTVTRQFKAAGKPIGGLETAKGQLMLFETLDPATQRAMLTQAAASADTAVREMNELIDAWTRGDVAALTKAINDDIDTIATAHQAIVLNRNRNWRDWAQRRMMRPGTLLLAVGAGHLVGDDGLPAMLEAKGLTVTRVQ